MLATIAATLVTSLGVGHIDAQGNVPSSDAYTVHGASLSLTLPARTEVSVKSRCNWLDRPKVGSRAPRWTENHSALMFGRVRFDGMSFENYSSRSVNVSAHIFNGCLTDSLR